MGQIINSFSDRSISNYTLQNSLNNLTKNKFLKIIMIESKINIIINFNINVIIYITKLKENYEIYWYEDNPSATHRREILNYHQILNKFKNKKIISIE